MSSTLSNTGASEEQNSPGNLTIVHGESNNEQNQHMMTREESELSSPTRRSRNRSQNKKNAQQRLKGNRLLKEVSQQKEAINAVAQEYTCPITRELMVDPVTAKDGHLYEREAIEETIRVQGGDLKSPKIGLKMGPELLPAISVRNTIRVLVESGSIEGEIVDQYNQRKKVSETKKRAKEGDLKSMYNMALWHKHGLMGLDKAKELYKEWRKKALEAKCVDNLKKRVENGDPGAMYYLGICYENGENGIQKNLIEAFKLYERSARRKDPMGMASAAYFTVHGIGGSQDSVTHGLTMMTAAAMLGSDFACNCLGEWYMVGMFGLPRDKAEAKYWYQKVIDGTCTYRHLRQRN